jgi:hypothetical protein
MHTLSIYKKLKNSPGSEKQQIEDIIFPGKEWDLGGLDRAFQYVFIFYFVRKTELRQI